MKYRLYSVLDQDAATYSIPMAFSNVHIMTREFRRTVNDPGQTSVLAKYPEAHKVFDVGTFDTDTGEIVSMKPELVMNVIDCKETV